MQSESQRAARKARQGQSGNAKNSTIRQLRKTAHSLPTSSSNGIGCPPRWIPSRHPFERQEQIDAEHEPPSFQPIPKPVPTQSAIAKPPIVDRRNAARTMPTITRHRVPCMVASIGRLPLTAEQRSVLKNVPGNRRFDLKLSSKVEKRTMSTLPTARVGSRCPSRSSNQIEVALLERLQLRNYATVIRTTGGGTINYPTNNDTATKGEILGRKPLSATKPIHRSATLH